MFCILSFPLPLFMLNQSSLYLLSPILNWQSLPQTEFLIFIYFFYYPSTCTLWTCGLCYRTIHLCRNSQFSTQKELSGIPWGGQASQGKDLSVCRCCPEQPFPTTSRRVLGVLHAISIHTRAGRRKAIPELVSMGRQSLQIWNRSVPSSHSKTNYKNLWKLLVSLSFPAKCRLHKCNQLELNPQRQHQQRTWVWVIFSSLWSERRNASWTWDIFPLAVCHRRSVARSLVSKQKLPEWKGYKQSCIAWKGLLEREGLCEQEQP